MRARGFTLIEMLAVIVLIAIAATVIGVSLHGRGRSELDATAHRIAAGLRDTRAHAMATRQPQWFTLDLRDHTYAAPGHDPRAIPADASIDVTSAQQDADAQGDARIRFFPDGSSSGGHIVLRSPRYGVRVNVDWLTGAVDVAPAAAASVASSP